MIDDFNSNSLPGVIDLVGRYADLVNAYVESVLRTLVPNGEDPESWFSVRKCEFVYLPGEFLDRFIYVDGVCLGKFEFPRSPTLECRFLPASQVRDPRGLAQQPGAAQVELR